VEIVTARFLLRDFTAFDAEGFRAYRRDPRFLARAPAPEPDELLRRFASWAAETPRRNYQLAILRRGEPRLVGCAGLRRERLGDEVAELGIELAPAFWGRHGYAVEPVRALLEFGFARLGLAAISGATTEDNAPAIRLARWFGAAQGAQPGAWAISRRRWLETRS
jgi:[ribosomal protein S5]-alanine N-acetyltransferase